MLKKPAKPPTELELEILKVLWDRSPQSVREVREALAPARKLAHTSVMTMLGILTGKGYLQRKKVGNGYVYSPRVSEARTLSGMVGDLVRRAFGGSSHKALLHLLQTSDLSESELRELRNVLKDRSSEM